MLSSRDEALEKAEKFLIHSLKLMPHTSRIVLVEGNGAILKDITGKEYIDGLSGCMGPLLIGHSHPKFIDAVERQVRKLTHHWLTFDNVPAIHLAEKLAEMTLGNLRKSYIAPGGGDAVEAAIKLVMMQRGKGEVISLYSGYHGMSLGLTSLCGMSWRRNRIPGGTRWPGFQQIPNPYCYRCHFGLEYPDCDLQCAKALDSAIKFASSDNVAAFLLEVVQGPGGHIEFPKEYFSEIKDICEEHEVSIIADEVQTGLGRCGAMFASELYDFKPDVLVLGKALGGGLPIGAAMFSEELTPAELGNETWHSLTFENNPLVCAVALAVIDIVLEEKLVHRANELGNKCRKALKDLSQEYNIIGDVRGPGLFIGVELVKDRVTKEPAVEEAERFVYSALDKGLITWTGGIGNVLKIKPPLTIREDQMDRLIEILDQTFKEVSK